MQIIITSALGHIGSQLIRVLPEQFANAKLILIDDLSTQRYCSLFNLPAATKYNFIETKVQNATWNNLLKNTDIVIHLAAITDATGTINKPELVYQNNFESTKILAEHCLNAKVPIIFPSSTSVYGSQSELVDENCQDLLPQSPYAACKIKEENYLKELFQKKLTGIICRLGTIYGTSPGMRFHTAVNKFCFQAVMNQPITVWETALHQKRPYLSLDDCCDAIIWIIKNHLYDRQLYNIVSNNFTVNNIIDEIKKYKSPINIQLVQHQIMNQLSYEVSSDKFRTTNFIFNGNLSDGIKTTIELLKNSSVEKIA